MVDLFPLQLNNRESCVTELITKYLENDNIFDVTLVCENFNETRRIEAHKAVLAANSPYFENLFRSNTNPRPTIFLNVSPVQMELILKYMYTGKVTTEFENSKQLLQTAKTLMVRGFCEEMELNFRNRPAALGTWENRFTAYNSESLLSNNITTEEGHRSDYETGPVGALFDFNNNDAGTQLDLNNNDVDGESSNSRNISLNTPNSNSQPNNFAEQTEPIDLSCVKKKRFKTTEKPRIQAKNKNYFEPNSEISLPLPSNISEASLLILKSVYDVKHHRKPNCDTIFREDPADPRLYVCVVCGKHVRSKWHHFQTHYSRDHKCADCDAVYSRIDTLRTHARKRHRTVIPRYYYGIPANVWHRIFIQCPGLRNSTTPIPPPTPCPPPGPSPAA